MVPPRFEGMMIMDSVTVVSVKDMRLMLKRDREVVKNMLADMKRMRDAIRAARVAQKALREQIKADVAIARTVRADHRALVEAKRAERVAARIAKTEKRLADLREKAAVKAAKAVRKPGPVKVFSAEEIAAINAANGAV